MIESSTTIPIAINCEDWVCDIEGQLCLAGTPGAGTDNWICKNKGWIIESK
jgi:hypothetical protein